MSDGGLLNSAASIEGLRASIEDLRDYLRATPMSTIVLLTPREAAKHLRCSERTLERHRLVGDGPPFVKIGASIRYPLSELEKWLADRLRRSTSEAAAPAGHRPRRKGRTELELDALK
jgi:excisionase family DNA binding protein